MQLAIVIPYYKIDFFDRTLFSLSHQTDKRFKVYIGNNNSPDDPTAIINNYVRDLDIVYRTFDNKRDPRTLSEQFIQCVSLISDEEWFMILGDDDILDEDVVADFYKNLPQITQRGINVIKFSTAIINEYDDIMSDVYRFSQLENSGKLLIKKLYNKTRSSLSEHIFKSSQFAKYKIPNYPLAWYSDDMMILHYSEWGNIFCISSSIVMIRISNDSISFNSNKWEDEKKSAKVLFYMDLLLFYHTKLKSNDLILFFTRLFNILWRSYDCIKFIHLLNIGTIALGAKKVHNILQGSKYSRKINVKKKSSTRQTDGLYINTYCFSKTLEAIHDPFLAREEFQVKRIKSDSTAPFADRKALNAILTDCMNNGDEFVVITCDGHYFSHDYSAVDFFKNLYLANHYRADILFGGGINMDFRSKIQDNLYWVNKVEDSRFIVLFRKFIPILLESNTKADTDFTEMISNLTPNKMVIYPFVSISV